MQPVGMFIKIAVLKSFTKFTALRTLVPELLFNNVSRLEPWILWKVNSNTGVFVWILQDV